MAVQEPKKGQSLLGQALKEYRKEHKLTQEELAEELSIDPRRLRAWENERPTSNIKELRRIADLLGIQPERLGIAASIYIPHTPAQIEEIVERIWSLMHDSRMCEAKLTLTNLLQDTSCRPVANDPVLLVALAHLYHVAGYVTSMSTRTPEVPQAIHYYHELETIARALNDQTLLNTALSYQGDMYRRMGDVEKAIAYLEAARDTTPLADLAAQGNAFQLLGRAYLPVKNLAGFERTMAQAEELAHQINAQTNSIHGHFNLGTVYEEYAKSYTLLKQMQKAMSYTDVAEKSLPETKNNQALLLIIKAEVFIHGGEIDAGKSLAVEAAKLARIQGHQRRLERIHKLKKYLHEQSANLSKAEIEIEEALQGTLEL